MDGDFTITIGNDGKPIQHFNGRVFKLQPKEKYFNSGPLRMHIYVWRHFNGPIPKGFHVHHKDENTWNNRIENLELVKSNKHQSYHSKKRIIENPEWFKKFVENGQKGAKKWHGSEEGIEWHKEHAKRMGFGKPKEPIKKKCEQCGNEFEDWSQHKGGKFCHPNCKAKALRKRYKEAGKSLRSKNKKQK